MNGLRVFLYHNNRPALILHNVTEIVAINNRVTFFSSKHSHSYTVEGLDTYTFTSQIEQGIAKSFKYSLEY